MTATTIPVPELSPEPPAEPFPKPAAETEPRKRGRPRKDEPPPEPVGPSQEDVANAQAAMGVTFKAASVLAAGRWGAHWILTDAETKAVGDAWGTAVAPYLSKLGPATPFLVAAMVTWSVIQPKIAETARLKSLKGPMVDEPETQLVQVDPNKPREVEQAWRVVPKAEPPR